MNLALVLVAGLAVLVLLAMNLLATWRIARDVLSDRRQRRAQWCLVWLVPLVGALLVLAVHASAKSTPARAPLKPADAGDDWGASGAAVRGVRELLDGD